MTTELVTDVTLISNTTHDAPAHTHIRAQGAVNQKNRFIRYKPAGLHLRQMQFMQ